MDDGRVPKINLNGKCIRPLVIGALVVLVIAYGLIWVLAPLDFAILGQFWPFSFLGLAGAMVASSTGVGGGVVFVPAFSLLRETGIVAISIRQTVGISFAIQCFGMSAGSITWLGRLYRRRASDADQQARPLLWKIVWIVLASAVPALVLTQYQLQVAPHAVFILFKGFSLFLGCLLLFELVVLKHNHLPRQQLQQIDMFVLILVGIGGGVATALFSVGVGEFLALYLFLRRFPVDVCVASAVICSAITVLLGVIYHLLAGHIIWEILIFAAPAVLLGGYLARWLAHALGAFRLKIATAIWIILSSMSLLIFS